MKTQKLIVIAAIACLLVGASGAALAEDCAEGFLTGTINESVVVNGTPCVISDAVVSGNIEIENADNATVVGSQLSGNLKVVNSGVVAIVGNAVRKNIRIRRNEVAVVVGNVSLRNLVVNRNLKALVKQNGALLSIRCVEGQGELDARFNNTEGEEECPAR